MELYQIFSNKTTDKDNFYQFILDADKVKEDVKKHGFKFLLECPYDATKGIKDEISLLRPILQRIYDSQNILARGTRFLISLIFSKIASHSI